MGRENTVHLFVTCSQKLKRSVRPDSQSPRIGLQGARGVQGDAAWGGPRAGLPGYLPQRWSTHPTPNGCVTPAITPIVKSQIITHTSNVLKKYLRMKYQYKSFKYFCCTVVYRPAKVLVLTQGCKNLTMSYIK